MSKSGRLFLTKHFQHKLYSCLIIFGFLCLFGCGRAQETESVSAPPAVIKTFPVVETTEPPPTETEELSTEIDSPEPVTWQAVYQAYIEKVRDEQPDLKFALLYMDEDDIPELCFYQGTCVDVYSYQDENLLYAFRFSTGYYANDFSYQPHECMVASQQGSVMGEGTYTEIETFERTEEEFIHSGKYGFSDSSHTIDSLKEQGYYTDDEEILEKLDVDENANDFLGDSWVYYSTNSERSDFSFYEMTDKNITTLLNEE